MVWEPEPVPYPEDDELLGRSARTIAADPAEDVAFARRAAPTFGGGPGDPSMLQSLHAFARRYGWRAYALPVLVVITVLALLPSGGGQHSPPARQPAATGSQPAAGSQPSPAPANGPAQPTASVNIPLKSDQPGARSQNTAIAADALPAGASYTKRGNGSFHVLRGSGPVVGKGAVHRYSVEVENGIRGIDLAQYARLVQVVLSDPRSWAGHGAALQRVDSGPIDFHVTLTSSYTVRKLCGYDIPIETSCYVVAGSAESPVNRVVINDSRWVRGDSAYVGDLNAYRVYAINHEDGHALGHRHAHQCLPGGLAPVMMQQTIGLRSATTHKMCQANPWPFPTGVQGAPGAEQADTPQNSETALKND